MKTTPRKIGEAMGAINALLSSKLPVKASYSVSKLARACQVELEDFGKAREKIFTEAGCTVDEASKKFVHDDKATLDKAVADADELSDTEVEINALPLDVELFGNAEVPGHAFLGLDWALKPEAA